MALKGHRRRNARKRRFHTPSAETPAPVTERVDPAIVREDWWWTISHKNTTCHRCAEPLGAGALIAFDSNAKRVLCESCADATGVAGECKESKRAKAARA